LRNPPEEWLFHRNYQLLVEESTGGKLFRWNYQFLVKESTGGMDFLN
jgi:hypothetical protein